MAEHEGSGAGKEAAAQPQPREDHGTGAPNLEACEACEAAAPFPLCAYLCLSAVMLASCLSISFIWPFVGFMIIEFGLTEDRNSVGYYTGLMLSMFFLGRAISSPFWGWVADRYGRKVVIYISLPASGLLMILLGLADNFRDALILRFLSGLANSLLSICKAMASEMCDARHQARAQTFPSVSWQIGLVLGPAIGGLLAQPCSSESVFAAAVLRALRLDDEIFCEKPFLLSCCAGGLLHIITLPCAVILPETVAGRSQRSCCCTSRRSYKSLDESGTGKKAAGARCTDPASDAVSAAQVASKTKDLSSKPATPKRTRGARTADEECEALSSAVASAEAEPTKFQFTTATLRFIVFNCAMVGVSNLSDNAVSIWCMAETSLGGLSWSVERIGEAYSFCGGFALLFQLLAAPALLRRFGALRALFITNCVNVPMYFLTPQIGLLAPWLPAPATFALMVLSLSLKQVCISVGFTGLSIITNASVPAAVRCRLQGTMTSAQSAMQACIPTISGLLFAWGLTSLPYGSELIFLLCGFLSVGVAVWGLALPVGNSES